MAILEKIALALPAVESPARLYDRTALKASLEFF